MESQELEQTHQWALTGLSELPCVAWLLRQFDKFVIESLYIAYTVYNTGGLTGGHDGSSLDWGAKWDLENDFFVQNNTCPIDSILIRAA